MTTTNEFIARIRSCLCIIQESTFQRIDLGSRPFRLHINQHQSTLLRFLVGLHAPHMTISETVMLQSLIDRNFAINECVQRNLFDPDLSPFGFLLPGIPSTGTLGTVGTKGLVIEPDVVLATSTLRLLCGVQTIPVDGRRTRALQSKTLSR